MASDDIDSAALVTWKFTQDFDGEPYQFGVKIQARAGFDWDPLLDDMETFATDELPSRIHKAHCVAITYSEWGTTGFTGFHQQASRLENIAMGSSNPLPPQCAAVVSLLNTSNTGDPIRRRRGRIYLGLMSQGNLDTNGRFATTLQTSLHSMMAALQTLLANTTPINSLDGVCIASEAAGKLFQADQHGVGIGVDTQRRRRQKVQENITYVDF